MTREQFNINDMDEFMHQMKGLAENSFNIIGVDPAGDGTDFFSISVMNHNADTKEQIEIFHHNKQKVSDPTNLINFIKDLKRLFQARKIRIDGNDLGYFIATILRNEYGSYEVEVMRGVTKVKNDKESLPLKEFKHAYLKKLLVTGKVKLISDDLILEHFRGWRTDYSCNRTAKYGHGDSVDAITLAALPMNWQIGGRELPNYDLLSQVKKEEDATEKFRTDLKSRIDYYRRNAKTSI
jgi:hypothetical protein